MLNLQIPFCVVIGWMMGKQMDLNFQLFETATLFITVLVVAFMLQVCSKFPYDFNKKKKIDVKALLAIWLQLILQAYSHFLIVVAFQEGTANYFKGLMLILCYLIVAASFFVHVDPTAGKNLLLVFCFKKIVRSSFQYTPLILFR